MDNITYQAVPMAADSTYEIGMLANADAYTADTLDGTGHIRVTVTASCVTVDYIRAYLPADTVGGLHQNGEVAFSYTLGTCITGVNEENYETIFNVFPNPANDRLKIQLPVNIMNFSAELINTTGQIVLQTETRDIDISKIASGMYYMRISADNIHINKKIIISR